MSTPSEIIYARVRADLHIGERLRKLQEDHSWPRPSVGKLVEILLDQALTLAEQPIAKPAKKKTKAKSKRKVRK
jgi:hypothetical protein